MAGAPGYRNKVGIAIGYIEYQYPGTRVAGAGAAAGPAGGPGHGPGELPDTLCQQPLSLRLPGMFFKKNEQLYCFSSIVVPR